VIWTLGPFHSDLPGPFRLALKLDGDVVSSAEVFTGFSHRGLRGILCNSTWIQGVVVMDRLDPESSLFSEWAYCDAIEKILELSAPPRARAIRSLLAELVRISAHFKQLSCVARAAGSETLFHFMLRERELVLDLLELSTGSRHMPAFFRVGGVREDISEGFLERLQEVCSKVLRRMEEYDRLLTENQAFFQRVAGRAVFSSEVVKKYAVSGIPAKSVHSATAALAKATPGDLHHRFVLKTKEIVESVETLKKLLVNIPGGKYRSDQELVTVPQGEATGTVEAPRGRLSIKVQSGGQDKPKDIQFETPSESLIRALPEILVGTAVEDLALCLASFDIQIGEVDR
jgi:NADH:ubiquinone oxidoreductase subunit D